MVYGCRTAPFFLTAPMREWLARILDWFRRDRLDAELVEELRFHRAQVERDALAGGHTPADAASVARRRLGNLTNIMEQARERWSLPWLDHLQQDARYAVRALRRSPGFSFAVIVTLGLGIGANAAIFSAVDRLLFRAPPLLETPGRTNWVYLSYPTPNGAGDFRLDVMPYPRYLELSQWTTSFARSAVFNSAPIMMGSGPDASAVTMAMVSASLFDFFDAPPALGRYFSSQEDRPPSSSPVAVLSYATWQARFAGRSDVLGTTVRLGGNQFTVIGVAARGFVGMSPERPPAVFIPVGADFTQRGEWWTSYRDHTVRMYVQRKPNVSVAAAASDLTAALLRAWKGEGPAGGPPQFKPHAIVASVLEERGPDRTSAGSVAALAGAMAVIVLLIAGANVANLHVGRALQRRREIAVRLALGVSRRRLLSHLLAESVLLATVGGLAGLGIAQWAGEALRLAILPPGTVAVPVASDTRTLILIGAAVVAVGVLTGLAPAWQALRVDVTRDLKLGGRYGTVSRSRMRVTLLVMQGALSVLLLVGAGLFVSSLRNARHFRLGYDVEPILNAVITPLGVRRDPRQTAALRDELLLAAQRVPGVVHAAVHGGIPLQFMRTNEGALRVPGLSTEATNHLPRVGVDLVTPDYFAAMGTRIVQGRGFEKADGANAPRVMIMSSSLAKLLWPNGNAIGKCASPEIDAPCATVVGITEDTRQIAIDDPSTLFYYLPAAQSAERVGVLTLRLRGNAASQTETVRKALETELRVGRIVEIEAFSTVVYEHTRPWRLGTTMFSVFGGLAFLLAAVGLYGVVAYDVGQRTREIGVRRALGARIGDVVGLVVRQGVLFGAIGVAVGVAVTLAAAGQVAPLLFGISPRDPAPYALVAVAMLIVAAGASVIPAIRAARVDPTVALRSE
jgi:predicted permease